MGVPLGWLPYLVTLKCEFIKGSQGSSVGVAWDGSRLALRERGVPLGGMGWLKAGTRKARGAPAKRQTSPAKKQNKKKTKTAEGTNNAGLWIFTRSQKRDEAVADGG